MERSRNQPSDDAKRAVSTSEPSAAFTLDTSGMVYPMEPRVRLPNGGLANAIRWPDLSPFAQGYVEAVFATWSTLRAEHRKRAVCKLNGGQIWLLKCGEGGFSRSTLRVPYSGHGSTATNYQCAGLIRRGWLADNRRNGIIRITDAGRAALRSATPLGFSDLSPEALAMILADCAEIEAMSSPEVLAAVGSKPGRETWELRQQNAYPSRFPPLTPYLGDDGKVWLKIAEASQ